VGTTSAVKIKPAPAAADSPNPERDQPQESNTRLPIVHKAECRRNGFNLPKHDAELTEIARAMKKLP